MKNYLDNMRTYLLFFGKSQDFTTHAFDNSDYIEDFNSVIKDFDLLESKIFTVDSAENKDMLAKYYFTAKDGKKYSLLKLYSFAQAFSGDRISGSIYGVALLSEGDISISKSNLNILNSTKNNFAKLCLNGLKFKSSDFFDDVNKIWNAVINHKEGNYLDKVTFTNRNISNANTGTKGFYVNNMFEDSLELDKQMNTASRIYISEDLAHLKRVHSLRGNDFKIYAKTKNGYEIYQEPKPIESPKVNIPEKNNLSPSTTSEEQKSKHKISDLEEENDELYKKASYYKKKNRKTFINLGVLASILFVTTITFFFTSDFSSDKKNNPDTYSDETGFEESETINNGKINLDTILGNSNNIDSLKTLIEDIKFASSFDPKISFSDSLLFRKKYKSIKGKSDYLKIDISQLDVLYNSKKLKLDSISNNKTKKEINIKINNDKPHQSQQKKEDNKSTKKPTT